MPQIYRNLPVAFTPADVHAYVENGEVPEPFLDVISQDVMRSPVQVAKTGHVYDRQSLAQWHETCLSKGLSEGKSCPNTNVALGRRAKLNTVPKLAASLEAFRAAVNVELAKRGEPPLEAPFAPDDGLGRSTLLGILSGCFGG